MLVLAAAAGHADARISFSTTRPFSPGQPLNGAVGDLNRDSHDDLVIDPGLEIFYGDANAGLTKVIVPDDGGPGPVVIADLNGDSKPDLVHVHAGNDNMSILLGDGNGAFTLHGTFQTGTFGLGATVGHFNGDSNLDVVTGGMGNVAVMLSDGAGGFSAPANVPIQATVNAVAVGDFNVDSKADVAAATTTGGYVFLGNGSGGLGSAQPVLTGEGAASNSVGVGDFNEDSRPDLVFSGNDGTGLPGRTWVALATGPGSFAAPVRYDNGASVAVADFDRDGHLDLAIADGPPRAPPRGHGHR